MTETESTKPDPEAPIDEKMERVRAIIAQIESGEVSLGRAKELRDEGTELLADVEEDLDLGEASVIERK